MSQKGAMNEDHLIKERRRQIRMIERTLEHNRDGRGTPLPGLKAARIMEGLSQRGLAEKIAGSQRTISELENQSRGAYPTTIRKLCQVLSVAPADLIRKETPYEKETGIMPTTTRYMDDGIYTICKHYYYDKPDDMEEFERLMVSQEAAVHSVDHQDEYVQVIIRPEW